MPVHRVQTRDPWLQRYLRCRPAVLKTAPIAIFSEAEAGALELASVNSVVLMVGSFVAHLLMSRWLLKGKSVA